MNWGRGGVGGERRMGRNDVNTILQYSYMKFSKTKKN